MVDQNATDDHSEKKTKGSTVVVMAMVLVFVPLQEHNDSSTVGDLVVVVCEDTEDENRVADEP